jgi:hypothetical protein
MSAPISISLLNLARKVDRKSVVEYLEAQYTFLEGERARVYRSLEQIDSAMASLLGTIQYLSSDDLPKADLGDVRTVRKPDDFKLSIFRGKTLPDVILKIFQDETQRQTLKIQDLIDRIYAPSNDDEVKACRASLTAALYRLDKEGSLVRIKPGEYAFVPKQYDLSNVP